MILSNPYICTMFLGFFAMYVLDCLVSLLCRLICCLLSYLQTLNKEISVSERALLHIEKQALIQVMIHQLALQFDYKKPLLVQKVQ